MKRIDIPRAATALFGLMAALAGPLAAASAKSQRAPKLESSLSFWPIACVVIALMGISVVAFKNAKRSHLD